MKTISKKISAVVLSCVLISLSYACTRDNIPPPKPPIPVNVATAGVRDIPVVISEIGNVEAYTVVSVKSLVAGEITRVYFKEGDFVKKGQMLFDIDQRPLKEALRQAEAALTRDQAQQRLAVVEAARYKELAGKGYVSKEQADQFATQVSTLNAVVEADKAAVKNAHVQLGYTAIRSPIDGKTGSVTVQLGNIVKENDVPYLVVINQIMPINVGFSVPEQHLYQIKKSMREGPLKVTATISGAQELKEEGVVSFLDNMVDNTTGTIRMKGEFANKDNNLWPGQYVKVGIKVDTVKGAVTVPSQAVLEGQSGKYVYVVGSDMTVQPRTVETGPDFEGLLAISKGLKPGEVVVTDGQVRLVPGAKVSIDRKAP